MLAIRNLRSGYGQIEVLHGIDIDVEVGTVVTMIGANGAGKTTLLMTICAHPRAWGGKILFDGEDITRLPTHALVRRGIAHAPEGRRIFTRMSVQENLQMGAFASNHEHFDDDLAFVLDLFPVLRVRLNQRGGTLSGGEQQMLAIARALMSRPRLLLLDEPSLGLAPLVARQVFDIIGAISRERHVAIFFIEQDAYQALKIADQAYVLVNGRITLKGTGAELLGNVDVQSAYMQGGLAPLGRGS